MNKQVLIVDDNQEMLLTLKEGLEQYRANFSVMIAGNGLIAQEKLKQHAISVVVTDLKMPHMDGFELLTHIMQHYPDIPVIIITGYSTPEMMALAEQTGAVGYIEKPFRIKTLAERILMALRKESEGGTLHNVSSSMFLQLIEMERKTCTIRLMCQRTEMQGILFFKSGQLYDARTDTLQGLKAAHEIFAWDEVSLQIQNQCPIDTKKIQGDLQGILLDAMRLKDESEETVEEITAVEEFDPEPADAGPNRYRPLRAELGSNLKHIKGIKNVFEDTAWKNLMNRFASVGACFDLGDLILAYIDQGESNDFLVVPDERPTIVTLDHGCPRDRIIESLYPGV